MINTTDPVITMMKYVQLTSVEDEVQAKEECKSCKNRRIERMREDCGRCKASIKEEETKLAMVGTDAVSLFPSLTGKRTEE